MRPYLCDIISDYKTFKDLNVYSSCEVFDS